jgi:hypothetical protein
MSKRLSFIAVSVAVAAFLLFYCAKDTTSPYVQKNAKFSLILKSSSLAVSDSIVTDTVGKQTSIGICTYLSTYIDTISIVVTKANGNIDTSFGIGNSANMPDTAWYVYTPRSPGKRTITGIAKISDGTTLTDTLYATIIGKPITVVSGLADGSADENGTKIYIITVSGDTPFVYQWYKDGANIGGNSSTLTVSPVTTNSGGLYTCLVTDKWGDTMTLGPARLTVNPIILPDSVKGIKTVSRINGNFTLLWNKSANTDSYIIFRSTRADSGFIPVDTITDTSFTDPIHSSAYYYYVVGLNMKGVSSQSPIVYSANINTAPKWSHDTISITTKENTPVTLNCADSCTDVNGDDISFKLLDGGPATDTLSGAQWKYTPSFLDSGSYVVKIRAFDGRDSSTLTMLLHVVNVNRKPEFRMDTTSFKISAGSSVSFAVKAVDLDQDSVSYFIFGSTVPHGTPAIANRIVTWKSDSIDNGNYTITVGATDGTDMATIEIQVAIGKVNAAPSLSAQFKSQNLAKNQTLRVVEGDSLKLSFKVSDPDTGEKFILKLDNRAPLSCGTVIFDSSAMNFTFVPSFTCVQKDSMTVSNIAFIVTDNGVTGTTPAPLSDTFKVNLNIVNFNRLPAVIVLQDTFIYQGKGLNFIVQAVDPDNDSTTLSASELSSGKLPDSASFNPKTGLFSWTPTFSQLGVYRIVFTASDGKGQEKDTTFIEVKKTNRPPQPQPQNLSTKRNQPLSITLTAFDPDGLPITRWVIDTPATHGTAVLANASQPGVTYTPAADFIGTDYFTFTASDAVLSSNFSAKIAIRVDTNNVAPRVTQAMTVQPPVINKGDSIVLSFSSNADAFPAPTFSWYKGGALLATNTVSTWKKTNVAPADAGYYYVIISSEAGRDSTGASVSVNVAPAFQVKFPATTTVLQGGTLTLTASLNADALPAPSFTWYKNGVEIPSANGNPFSKSGIVYADSGYYHCIVANIAGRDSAGTWLKVKDITPPVIYLKGSLDTSISLGATWTEPAGDSAIDDRIGTIHYSPSWVSGTVNTGVIGKYTVTYTVSDGDTFAVAKRNVSVGGVAPSFTAPLAASTIVRQGGTLTLSVTANGTANPTPAFIWYKNGGVISSATTNSYTKTATVYADSGSYAVVAYNAIGRDSSFTHVKIRDITPPVIYLKGSLDTSILLGSTWTEPAGDSAIDDRIGTIHYSPSWVSGTVNTAVLGKYTLTYTVSDGDTFKVATRSVTVAGNAPVFTTPLAASTTVGQGSTLSLAVTVNGTANPAPAFIWYKNGVVISGATTNTYTKAATVYADSGNYAVVAYNSSGRDSSFTHVKIKDITPPVITLIGSSDTSIVLGSTWTEPGATATDDRVGNIPYSPSWVSGAVNSSVIGKYVLTYTVSDGDTFAVAKRNVSIGGIAPSFTAPLAAATTVHQGNTLTLSVTVNANANPAPTYIWYKNGVVLAGATANTYTKTSVVYADSGNYAVVAYNSIGRDSSVTKVTVDDVPAVPALVSPAGGASGLPVSLNLIWNKSATATSYHVQVSSDSGFASLFTSDSLLTDTTKSVTGLTKGATYYWRVRAKNAVGVSVWSGRRNFTAIRQFALTVAATHGTVTKSPDNVLYDSGSVVTLTPAAAVGYRFTDWTGDLTGTTNPGLVTMNGAKNITANFTITKYSLTVSALNGTVTKSPDNAEYDSGTVVTVTAVPAVGYHFTGWSGDLTGATNPTTITVNGVKNVTATFAINTFTITASAGTNGTITPNGATPVNYGADQSFNMNPAIGYHVADVLVDGVSVGPVASHTFTNVTATHSISVTFLINTYTITASAGTNGSIAPNGVSTVDYGATPTYNITPVAGYHVNDVLVDGSSIGALTSYTFPGVTANRTISASFAINTFTITASAGANGSISPNGATSVNYNDNQTYTISPVTGYHVADVLVDGGTVGAVTSYPFTNVTATHTISATFAIDTYTLSVNAGTGGTITAPSSSPISVSYNTATAITAVPSTGYKFVNWTASPLTGVSFGNANSSSTTVTLTSAGTTVTANFQALTCSWAPVYNTGSATINVMSLATHGSTIFMGTQKFGSFRSINDGTDWDNIGVTGMYAEAFSQFGSATLAGDNGNIYYSTNDLTDVTSTIIGSQVYSFTLSGSTYYAGIDGAVVNSTDGTNWNWVPDNSGTLSGRSVFSVILYSGTIYAGTDNGLYYQVGNYWYQVNVAQIPAGNVKALVADGGTVLAGTASGVYRLNTSSGTWSAVNTGITNTDVRALIVNNGYVFAGTADGVYVSTDNGTNWTKVNGGIPGGAAVVAALSANSTYIFFGSGQVTYKSLLP